MYVLEVMRLDGKFVPVAVGEDTARFVPPAPNEIWRLWREGVLAALSLTYQPIAKEETMQIEFKDVTPEKWARAKREAKAKGVHIAGNKGEVVVDGIVVKYEKKGTTVTLDIAKPWYVPEAVVKAALNKAIKNLE